MLYLFPNKNKKRSFPHSLPVIEMNAFAHLRVLYNRLTGLSTEKFKKAGVFLIYRYFCIAFECRRLSKIHFFKKVLKKPKKTLDKQRSKV